MVEESKVGWHSRDLIFCFNTESQRDRGSEFVLRGKNKEVLNNSLCSLRLCVKNKMLECKVSLF